MPQARLPSLYQLSQTEHGIAEMESYAETAIIHLPIIIRVDVGP
jgi:hypothetical protein